MTMSGIDPWMLWGVALLIALPVLVVLLGELTEDAARNPEWRAFAKPLLITRNGVLPFGFAAILLRQVAGLPGTHLAVKIVDTAVWIIILNAALAFMNVLLFDENSKSSSRIKIPRLLLDILRFIFVVCGAAVTISTIWGVNLGSLVTALGVGSVVIGLALQDTLGSLFSGIAMVSARQFRAGDWVRFGNDEGVIVSQNWRTVTIKTRSGDALIIPNGVIARAPLTVIAGGAGNTNVGLDFRFPYQYPPDMICKLLAEAAVATPGFLLDVPPVARVAGYEDHAVRYGIAVKTTDPAKLFPVRGDYLANVWYLCQRNGVHMIGEFNTNFPIIGVAIPSAPHGPEDLINRIKSLNDFPYPAADLKTLLRHGRLERYRDNQILIGRGKVAAQIYVLLSGKVRAIQSRDTGEDFQLHSFEPGQFILAKAMLRAAACPFTLKSIGETEVVAVPIADFKAFCGSDIRLAQEFEQILSAREDAAQRTLTKVVQDQLATGDDRAKLMRDLFK